MNKPGLISLFCGPGGFDAGFAQAGFATRLAYDKDEACVRTHRRNHPESSAIEADLSTLGVEEVVSDWRKRSRARPCGVIGGSPCQSFSVSNRFQHPDDVRHTLPDHFGRLLAGLHEAFTLDFVVFENVPGLAAKKHAHRLDKLRTQLRRIGFNIFTATLDAQHFGVPQMRPRVFVVGINQERHPDLEFRFPIGSWWGDPRTVADVLRGLPEPVYFDRSNPKPLIPFHPNHWCMRPRAARFSDGSLRVGHAQGRSFRVLCWDRPSYTVAYGNREVHVHPSRHRRLSMYEALLLQGFPKSYVLEGTLSDQIRLVSEAVAPPVARALAIAIRKQLKLSGSRHGARRQLNRGRSTGS
jgi:DNA (cytosine-5)-methyltransferase 1